MIRVGSRWKDREDGEIVTVIQVMTTRVVFEYSDGKRDGCTPRVFRMDFEEVEP